MNLEINFNKLEKEVHNAINAEEKYWRENNAKLRAIEQRVPTYEDFRQMVLASNLRPLDKGETLRSGTTKSLWNTTAGDGKTSQDGNSSEKNYQTKCQDIIPKTNLEFIQIWRKIPTGSSSNEIKWKYLENIGIEKLIEIFKPEINGDLLGQFLVLFDERLSTLPQSSTSDDEQFSNDCDFIIKLLDGFRKCNRFELNILFLNSQQSKSCKNIFEKLSNYNNNKSIEEILQLNQIKASYLK